MTTGTRALRSEARIFAVSSNPSRFGIRPSTKTPSNFSRARHLAASRLSVKVTTSQPSGSVMALMALATSGSSSTTMMRKGTMKPHSGVAFLHASLPRLGTGSGGLFIAWSLPNSTKARHSQSDALPGFLWNFSKYLDDLRVELAVRRFLNLFVSHGKRQSPPIRAGRGNRVKGVRDGKYSRPNGDFLACQTLRIACAFVAFLMRQDDFGGGRQKCDAADQVVAYPGVRLHD